MCVAATPGVRSARWRLGGIGTPDRNQDGEPREEAFVTDGTEANTPPAAAWSDQELEARRVASGRSYLEFLRAPDLSAGMYVLEAGATDRQLPHTEDEIYVVLSGRGRLRMGDEDVPVGPGSIAFVAARVDHRFHDIEARLTVLVVFGPAEYSRNYGT
jgi:mannose-6-phosphate isomerase-like protein (cupin superfamily)